MKNPSIPPRLADALLRRSLPEGDRGLSILGDLRQEFDERVAEGERLPQLWYWREALALSLRYRLVGARRPLGRRAPTPAETMKSGEGMMPSLMNDLRYAVRMLLKTPLLSLIAILTVGLGVGLTTHTFSVVYGTVIRGLPFEGGDRMMFVEGRDLSRNRFQSRLHLQDYLAVRERQTSFDDIAAFRQQTVSLAGEGGPPESIAGTLVSANTLSLVNVAPFMGRTFRAGEDHADAAPTVVLGHGLWEGRYGSDQDIIGKSIRVDGASHEVIGVMPAGFKFPFLEDLWLPLNVDPVLEQRDGDLFLLPFGRLREGVSEEVAQAELDAISAQLAAEFPEFNENKEFYFEGFADRSIPKEIKAVLFVMLGAVFGVLLISCANVANLLLARASVRAKEVAVRMALGSSRWRVIRQLLVESALLASIGGAVGLVFSYVGVNLFNAAIIDVYKPYWIDIRIDAPAMLFTLAITMVAALAAGTIPALRASGAGVGEILKDESRGSSSLRMSRFSSALVVGELAVSCGLLIGAGLMVKSIVTLRSMDMGFETEQIFAAGALLSATDYPTKESRVQFFGEFIERAEGLPGVRSVGLASQAPGLGAGGWTIGVEGVTYPEDRDYPVVRGIAVRSRFFETMSMQLKQGRRFTDSDHALEADATVIVNESFAARYLDGDPLGRRIRVGLSDTDNPWMTVVGVVNDVYIGGGVGGLGNSTISPEHIYISWSIFNWRGGSLLLRTSGDPEALAPEVRKMVTELDSDLPLFRVGALDTLVRDDTWAFGIFGSLFTTFGVVALFMAAVGLYGVMAFSVGQRKKEMGVRMAMGADTRDIMRLVLRKGVLQLGVGITIGLALGYGLGQPLEAVLFDVQSTDPTVYLSIIGTLGLAGLLATIIPAQGAARVDPAQSLRQD